MKAFSDLEQSKKLAEILPLESADMFLAMNGILPVISKYIDDGLVTADNTAIPCWSLAALIGVIPKTINFGYENDSTFVLKPLTNGKYLADYYEISYVKDNPIDACYEMILKLHELNLL